MRRLLLLILIMTHCIWTKAQESDYNNGDALLFRFSYGLHLPGGDLADRFGNHFSLGTGVDFLTAEQNWIFGIEGNFFFGNNVKTDVLAGLRTPEGFIYGNDQSVADIQLRQRGFYIGGLVGKLLPLSKMNDRSGLRLTVGAGLLQHKIRIQEDPNRTVPQLTGDYKKGYDRLSNGLALSQFIGYQLLSQNGRINFCAGVEIVEGFTRNRRDFNFDTRRRATEARFDLQLGLRLTWILPFYLGSGEDIYY